MVFGGPLSIILTDLSDGRSRVRYGLMGPDGEGERCALNEIWRVFIGFRSVGMSPVTDDVIPQEQNVLKFVFFSKVDKMNTPKCQIIVPNVIIIPLNKFIASGTGWYVKMKYVLLGCRWLIIIN